LNLVDLVDKVDFMDVWRNVVEPKPKTKIHHGGTKETRRRTKAKSTAEYAETAEKNWG